MITNNLKTVSRGASKPHRYAVQHSLSTNPLTVRQSLFSGTASRASGTCTTKPNGPTIIPITFHSKSSFSSSQQSMTANAVQFSDLIPKLPPKDAHNVQMIESHLVHSGQGDLVQFLSDRLESTLPDHQPLDQSAISFFQNNANDS